MKDWQTEVKDDFSFFCLPAFHTAVYIIITTTWAATAAAGLDAMLSFTHTGNRLTGMQVWDGINLPASYTALYDAHGPCLADTRKGLQFSYNVA